jgi:hypothetical protein
MSFCFFSLFIYLAGGFVATFFVADFGFATFFGAAGFFVAVDFGFFGVVAFLTFGLTTFFFEVFFAPAGLAAPVGLGLVCFGFFVFVALADFGVALDFVFDALAIVTFFGLAAVVVVVDDDVVVAAGVVVAGAGTFVLATAATFLAGFDPADFERARFFVPDDVVLDETFFVFDDEVFFGFVDFFFGGLTPSANLNEPLAPLPFVCLKDLDLTPFLRANLRC